MLFRLQAQHILLFTHIKNVSRFFTQRVTSPLPEVPIITYIMGLAILTSDNDGLEHSIVITVEDPHSLDSSCPVGGVHPCLVDGSLNVVLDGEEALLGPGSVGLGEHVVVSAVNLPGPCRTFGFEQYWERKQLESALHGRRLQSKQQSMGEWILGVRGERILVERAPTRATVRVVTKCAEAPRSKSATLFPANAVQKRRTRHACYRRGSTF